MVELRGVEPLASSMRPRRSSQLSYSPEGTSSYRETSRERIGTERFLVSATVCPGSCEIATGLGVHRQVLGAIQFDLTLVLNEE